MVENICSKIILINPLPKQLKNINLHHSSIMSIAFDLDGVLLNNKTLQQYIYYITNISVHDLLYDKQKKYNTFHFKDPEGIIKDEDFANYVNMWIKKYSYSAPPNPTVESTIKWIKSKAQEFALTIITARKDIHIDVTMQWIEKVFPQTSYNLIMTNSHKKADVVEALGVEIFVDDRYRTIKQMVGKIVFPIIYNAKYNSGRGGIRGAYRIKRLSEVKNFLLLKREEINKRFD